jgi:hypothetical protein
MGSTPHPTVAAICHTKRRKLREIREGVAIITVLPEGGAGPNKTVKKTWFSLLILLYRIVSLD